MGSLIQRVPKHGSRILTYPQLIFYIITMITSTFCFFLRRVLTYFETCHVSFPQVFLMCSSSSSRYLFLGRRSMHPTGCHWTKQIIFNRCECRFWMVLMDLDNDVSSCFFDILHCGKLGISQTYHSRMVLTTQLWVYLRFGRGHDGDSSLVCTRICTVYIRFYMN